MVISKLGNKMRLFIYFWFVKHYYVDLMIYKKVTQVSHLYFTCVGLLTCNGNVVVHLKVVVCYSYIVLPMPTAQMIQNAQLMQDN